LILGRAGCVLRTLNRIHHVINHSLDQSINRPPTLIPKPLQDYFGELEEESIRDNFVIIYELMDETMDFGYPQTTEAKILRCATDRPSERIESHSDLITHPPPP
jgi:hypothetical protein